MCNRRGCNSKHEGHMEYDARGIPLGTCCPDCREQFLKKYRPEVLRNPQYSAPEQIEPDPPPGG